MIAGALLVAAACGLLPLAPASLGAPPLRPASLDAPPLPPECAPPGACRLTARGWWPAACVHELPHGSAVRELPGSGVAVTYPNGSSEIMPDCAAPIPAESLARLQRRNESAGALRQPAASSGQFGACEPQQPAARALLGALL